MVSSCRPQLYQSAADYFREVPVKYLGRGAEFAVYGTPKIVLKDYDPSIGKMMVSLSLMKKFNDPYALAAAGMRADKESRQKKSASLTRSRRNSVVSFFHSNIRVK